MSKRNWMWGAVLGVTFGLGLALGASQTAEARSPSSGGCGACRQRVMDSCCQRVTGDTECQGNAAAIGQCGREASSQCGCG